MSHPLLFFCGLWMLGLGLRSLRWSPRVAWMTCPVGPLKVVRWPRPPPRGPCAVPHLIGNGVDSKKKKNKVIAPHHHTRCQPLERARGALVIRDRELVRRTRRDRFSVAFLVPPPPHHSTPSVCLNKGPTRDQELGSFLDDRRPFDLLPIMRRRTSWSCEWLLS